MEIRTEIQIDAPAERVWSILTDFADYAGWNPFIRQVRGEPRRGERLEVRLEPPGGRPITLRPEVLNVEPGRELRWIGKLFVPGLFDGEHVFEIERLDGGSVRFVQRERVIGLAVPVLQRLLEGPYRAGFEAMNEALKSRAEAGAPVS